MFTLVSYISNSNCENSIQFVIIRDKSDIPGTADVKRKIRVVSRIKLQLILCKQQ